MPMCKVRMNLGAMTPVGGILGVSGIGWDSSCGAGCFSQLQPWIEGAVLHQSRNFPEYFLTSYICNSSLISFITNGRDSWARCSFGADGVYTVLCGFSTRFGPNTKTSGSMSDKFDYYGLSRPDPRLRVRGMQGKRKNTLDCASPDPNE